ncbi:MAG: hypothetical protein QME79_07170 [Bacillota bacterium]|nr:hypothetical protein [Bacillota bacterium]
MSHRTPFQQIVFTTGISVLDQGNVFGRKDAPPPSAVAAASEPEKVSAEYSVLWALRKEGRLAARPVLTLFYTDTPVGRQSFRVLEKVLAEEFNAAVNGVPVRGFDVTDRQKLKAALADFLRDLGAKLHELRLAGLPTAFVPLGGYKVMTSFGYIAGSFYGFPSLYLHGLNQVLQEIPAVPLQIDQAFLEAYAPLLRRLKLEGVVGWGSLSEDEQAAVEAHPYFFERAGEVLELNAFGHFLLSQERYASLFGTWFLLSDQARKSLRHYWSERKWLLKQLRTLVKKVQVNPQDPELHHERDKGFAMFDGLKLCYGLWQGPERNSIQLRVAWRYEKAEDALYVNGIWGTHDACYAELERNPRLLVDDQGDFRNLSQEVHSA